MALLPTYSYVTLTGTIIPDVAAITAQVYQEYQSLFGTDIDLSPFTPQGLLAAAEIAARIGVARNNANLANQINPNLAGGIYLDAEMALTGSARLSNTFSTIPSVQLNGVAGTTISTAVIVQDLNANAYSPIAPVVLDDSGSATVTFQALLPGPINTPADTLTQIINGVFGLETVNNPNPSIPGSITQSDQGARLVRRQQLALQGQTIAEATISRVNAVPGVRAPIKYLENPTNDTIVLEGITLVPHSMWACVEGGDDTAVALAIESSKSTGGNFNGATSVTIVDPASGQSYEVLFDRPTLVPCLVRVVISADSNVPDPIAAVVAAILAYENGLLENESGLTVGISVSPSELSGAIKTLAPSIFVHSLQVAYASDGIFTPNELAITWLQVATIAASAINVSVV